MRIENDLIHEAAARQLNLDEYKELLIILSNTSKNCLMDSISPTDLIKILSYMDFENAEVSDVAERIAKLIFPIFPIDFVQQSSEMLVTIFGLDNYHLTLLIFGELTNIVKVFKNQGDVIIFTDEVMHRIVNIIFNQYLELSWTAQRLLITYCDQSPDICLDILKKVLKPKFRQILSNSVNVFRYIDVGIEMVLKSKRNDLFETAIDHDVLTVINAIVNSEDLLAHMNVLEVMKKLTSDPIGYKLVVDKHVLDNLYKRLPAIVECPFNSVLLPGYLSMFGELCRLYLHDTLDKFGDFLTVLKDQFETVDISLRLQMLEIFTSFAAVPHCKLFLAKEYESIISKALLAMIASLSSSDPDYQSRAANTLADLLSADNDPKYFHELESINQQLCATLHLDQSLLSTITRMIVTPIEALKLAGLTLAVALSTQRWGQQLLCNKLDLIDHLLIRSDQWQSCIDRKYELINNLVVGINQHGAANIGAEESVAMKLCQYNAEGKYFAPAGHHEMMVDTDV